MKALIIGANGQLGRCLQDVFPSDSFTGYTRKQLDLFHPSIARDVLQYSNNDGYTHVINCAAYTNVAKAENEIEKAYAVNCHSVREIARWCKQVGATLIHVSTDYASETPAPRNIYGQSKLAGELAIQAEGCSSIIIRTSALFSEYGNTSFLRKILDQKDSEIISVASDYHCHPTYAQDLAVHIFHLLQEERPSGCSLVSFGNQVPVRFSDFAAAIVRYAGMSSRIEPINVGNSIRPRYAELPNNEGAANYEYSLRHCIQRMKDKGLV